MGDLPNRKQGWDLVEYQREWIPSVSLLTYEHPRLGRREVLRGLVTGRVVTDPNPWPEPPNRRPDAFRSWR